MLISIHIPKTAGTAFGELLSRRFGDRLLYDYSDRPLSHTASIRIGTACLKAPFAPLALRAFDAVHGHFLPLKYSRAAGDFVTWLRDPAQRVVSRYEHYRRDVAEGRPLQHVRGLRPGLSLAEFAEIPRFQNTYAKYFAGFPLARVACFGFSEHMPEGLERMKRRLGLDLGAAVNANANPDKASPDYEIPERTRHRILALNREDLRIWSYARQREGV